MTTPTRAPTGDNPRGGGYGTSRPAPPDPVCSHIPPRDNRVPGRSGTVTRASAPTDPPVTSPTSPWCSGYHPQPAHVPDNGALIVTNDRGAQLCRACWQRWNATDHTKATP
jgi:hypothetical protein